MFIKDTKNTATIEFNGSSKKETFVVLKDLAKMTFNNQENFVDKITKKQTKQMPFKFFKKNDLTKDSSKIIFVIFELEYYHTLFNTLASILYEHDQNRNVLIVLCIENIEDKIFTKNHLVFVFNLLNKLNIKYTVGYFNNNTIYKLNNYKCYLKHHELIYDYIKIL